MARKGQPMKYIFDFIAPMWAFSKTRTILLFVLTAIASLTEGIGIMLLVPLLGTIQKTSDGLGKIGDGILNTFETLGLPHTSTGLIIAFLALIILRNLIVYAKTIVSSRIQYETLDGLRVQCFSTLLSANWKWLITLRKSDNSNVLLSEVGRIGSGMMISIMTITAIITITVNLIVALFFSLEMTIIAILVGASLVYLLRFQHTRSKALGETLEDAQSDIQQIVEEGFSGLKLTKILGSEVRHSNAMSKTLGTLRDQLISYDRTQALSTALFQILIALFLAIFLWAGLTVFEVPLPTLMILVLVLARMGPKLRTIQNLFNELIYSWPAVRNLKKLLAEAEAAHEPAVNESNRFEWPLNDAVTFTKVSFSYQETTSLNDISLVIPAQKTTAIIGPSGAGKSTFADMLMGLLPNDNGVIQIDGHELTPQNRTDWRRHVAYVPQDVFLFHDTIRKNLLWANPDATETELTDALNKAAAEFVFAFPKGLDTVVGDAGQRLSGGERQRISLARAMLQKPKLLILDEATSALDLENEKRIRTSLKNLHGDLTVVVIGHRLPTLQDADHVIVFDNGQVVASGLWESIQSKADLYLNPMDESQ
jgi:ATP-binding cassette subfamily C protein